MHAVSVKEIEEAAKLLAAKSGGAVPAAETALQKIAQSVATILGKEAGEVEVLSRFSSSKGTHNLAFIVDEVPPVPRHIPLKNGPEVESTIKRREAATEKVKEIVEHLQGAGLDASHATLGSLKFGDGGRSYTTHAVDVTLNGKVLNFVPGQKTAALTVGVNGISRVIPSIPAIEEAAQVLAAGKGEVALAAAKTALADMKHAVETILGREVEVIKRTSLSKGTERFTIVLGESALRTPTGATIRELEARAAESGMYAEVVEHLRSKGLTAEGVSLHSEKPGFIRPSVDVVLDEKVLGYIPGQQAAKAIRSGSSTISPPPP